MSGRVFYRNQSARQGGILIETPELVTLQQISPFVSRAGDKLNSALDFWKLDVKDLVALDIGASTGGFTDCLLQRGVQKVYALDVGKNLLDDRLRKDPRVIILDEVNVRFWDPNQLKEKPDFIVVDVSFISLSKILPTVWKALPMGKEAVILVKPQFEATPKQAPKGIVKDEAVRQELITQVTKTAIALSFICAGTFDSPVKGTKGNRETFMYLKKK